jgi:mannitol-specific phosphotransferase system IIBC component
MESTQIVGKKSMKLRFIVLQIVTLLLVAVVLFSFSNAPLALFRTEKLTQNPRTESKPSENSEAVKALENNLVTYQNLVKEKEQKINELEASMKTMRASAGQTTSSATEAALRDELQKMELELSKKEATISELVARVQTLEKAKPSVATPSSDKALVDKLRSDIQKLETRNALLVKLNNDLKKNNEFLSSQQKQ